MKSYKTKNMNLQLFADPKPSETISFFNYFYLDGELTNTVYSGAFDPQEEIYPNHLYIVYHNSNIYGMLGPGAAPNYTDIISYGDLILENINPEYTGGFFENKHGEGTQQNPYYLVEDEVVDAGYFADFTTYHTTKAQSGYNSTINLTNCTCNKSNETGLTGSYSATITVDEGYYLSSVTSTSGIVDIATNLKTATVTIENIVSDFIITAVGTQKNIYNIVLHPNNNGEIDYTTDILPKAADSNIANGVAYEII